jgi:hypothetical protein
MLFSGPNAFAKHGLCLLLHALAVAVVTVLHRLPKESVRACPYEY